jgi:hypothetical protein
MRLAVLLVLCMMFSSRHTAPLHHHTRSACRIQAGAVAGRVNQAHPYVAAPCQCQLQQHLFITNLIIHFDAIEPRRDLGGGGM